MKNFYLILIIFLIIQIFAIGAPQVKPSIKNPVSLVRVIANPHVFEGQTVEVTGYLCKGQDRYFLAFSRDHIIDGLLGESLVLKSKFSDQINLLLSKLSALYPVVTVSGKIYEDGDIGVAMEVEVFFHADSNTRITQPDKLSKVQFSDDSDKK